MKKGVFILTFVFSLLLASSAHAAQAQETLWDMANSDQYGKKVGGQLGRGLLNFATCFVDVIVQTVQGTQDGPPFVGTLTGLGSGIACTALRASSGALDVATFWVPGFNGIPVSKSYANCLEFEEDSTTYAPGTDAGAPTYAAPDAASQAPQARNRDAYDYVKK
jgi:putative exosortase-associated protein (TIGR04073 family)